MDCKRACGKASAPSPKGNDTEASSGATSHGLCVQCYALRMGAVETEELVDWVDSDINRLPTGKILLDAHLRIVGYSKEEESLTGLIASEIMGKEFFKEVAPCMQGEALSEWCADHVDDDALVETSLDWLLKLRSGDRVASLEMCAGKGRVTILVDLTGHGAA